MSDPTLAISGMMADVKVFLIRHSHAIDEHHGLIDEDRHLTAEGRLRARAVGAALAREGVGFDAVISSPLARAVQTAELVCEKVGYLGIIAISRTLVHSLPARLAAAELPARGVKVACFGHMPHLSELGALLTGRPKFPRFKPCQVMVIDDGEARWTLDPDSLRLEPMTT